MGVCVGGEGGGGGGGQLAGIPAENDSNTLTGWNTFPHQHSSDKSTGSEPHQETENKLDVVS